MGALKQRILSRDEIIMFCVILGIVLFLLWGCQRSFEKRQVQEDENPVAKVNDYTIYVSDVSYLVKLSVPSKKFSLKKLGFDETKSELLDELITKKVLVQEASRRKYDREKEFRREIEKYWEQALVKFLLNEKAREITGLVKIDDSEVEEEYVRRKKLVLAELVVVDEMSKAEELVRAGDKFDVVKESFKESIVHEEAPEWRESGDLPEEIEESIFSMSSGETTGAIPYDGNWVVLRVVDVKVKEMPPLEEIREEITQDIATAKEEDMMAGWISDLKSEAKVEIDEETLESIDLEELYHQEK